MSTIAKSSSSSSLKMVPVLSGVRDLVDKYDTFLIDMWGVMHDGSKTYPGVLEAISQLKQLGKNLIILSNSSKRQSSTIAMLQRMGIEDPNYTFSNIITSGEVTHHLLSQTKIDPTQSTSFLLVPKPWSTLEPLFQSSASTRKIFCFGSGEGDAEFVHGLSSKGEENGVKHSQSAVQWTLTSSVEQADLLLARGTFTIPDPQVPSSSSSSPIVIYKANQPREYQNIYEQALKTAAKRRLPLIVANPDKVRPQDHTPMPGTIAADYQQALWQEVRSSTTTTDTDDNISQARVAEVALALQEKLIKYIGKPFSDVYEIALRPYKNQDDTNHNHMFSRICMIGDALETDITGGSNANIDTIWVIRTGVHNSNVQGKESESSSFEEACANVLETFNENRQGTYSEKRPLTPTAILPSFQW